MALLPNINVGTTANDGTGSSLRDAFTIVNENFQFIEAFFPNSAVSNLTANLTSTGTSTFNYLNANNISVLTLGNAGTLITGNIVTAAQPNITSLGTLSTLTVSGNTTINANAVVENDFTVNGTVFTNGTLSAGASFIAGADSTLNGAQSVNVTEASGSYVVSGSDYTVLANVSGNANCTITLPNAASSVGRVLRFIYWDNTFVNDLATVVSLNIQANAGNIIIAPQFGLGTGYDFNSNTTLTELVSNGQFWFRTI